MLISPGSDALERVQLNIDEELLDADMPAHTGLGFGNRMGKRCLSELGRPFYICASFSTCAPPWEFTMQISLKAKLLTCVSQPPGAGG